MVILTAAQHGPYPRNEFIRLEGLRQIVIRASIKSGDAVIRFRFGGQHHNGGLDALGPELLQHLHAIHLGHHYIQDDGIIFPAAAVFIGIKAVMYGIHRKLIFLKKDRQRFRQVYLVLRYEQTHLHPLFLSQLSHFWLYYNLRLKST